MNKWLQVILLTLIVLVVSACSEQGTQDIPASGGVIDSLEEANKNDSISAYDKKKLAEYETREYISKTGVDNETIKELNATKTINDSVKKKLALAIERNATPLRNTIANVKSWDFSITEDTDQATPTIEQIGGNEFLVCPNPKVDNWKAELHYDKNIEPLLKDKNKTDAPCFVFSVPKELDTFSFKVGLNSTTIDATASTSNPTLYHNMRSGCVDGNGTIHIAYLNSDGTAYHGRLNSFSGTASLTQITSSTAVSYPGVICYPDSNNVTYVALYSGNINFIHNKDNGITWPSPGVITDSIVGTYSDVSCIGGKDPVDGTTDVNHCSMVDGSDRLEYSNSSSSYTTTFINDNTLDDTDTSSIALDAASQPCVVGIGTDQDDVDIWCRNSAYGSGWGDTNRQEIDASINALDINDDNPTLAITGYRAYVGYVDSVAGSDTPTLATASLIDDWTSWSFNNSFTTSNRDGVSVLAKGNTSYVFYHQAYSSCGTGVNSNIWFSNNTNRTLPGWQETNVAVDGCGITVFSGENNYQNLTFGYNYYVWGDSVAGDVIIDRFIAQGEDFDDTTAIASCPYTIQEPGNYKLINDIVDQADTCITINASDVIFDGQGYTIDGDRGFNDLGVQIINTQDNVTLTNIRVQEFDDNFNLGASTNLHVYNVTSYGLRNTASYAMEGGQDSTYENNRIYIDSNGGIAFYPRANNVIRTTSITCDRSSTSYGVWFGFNRDLNNLTNLTIQDCTYGLRYYNFADDNIVANSSFLNNTYGIIVEGSADFGINNVFTNNFFNSSTRNVYTIVRGPSFYNSTGWGGSNIIGGSIVGGNYWGLPNGTGYSDTCTDADSNGICDVPYNVSTNDACVGCVDGAVEIDYLPLSGQFSAGGDTCTYTSGDWNILGSDQCVLSTAEDLGGNDWRCTGSGYVRVRARITNVGVAYASNGCVVYLEQGGQV